MPGCRPLGSLDHAVTATRPPLSAADASRLSTRVHERILGAGCKEARSGGSCCAAGARGVRGVARHFEQRAVRHGYKATAVAGGCALVESSQRAGAVFPALVRLLPSSLPGGHGRRTPESGHQGWTVFHLPSTPWVPEIRPINISRSKMKQGLTWYRLQRLRTALSRHGCAPLASPPPRIELCALELICRDHARDAGTLRH